MYSITNSPRNRSGLSRLSALLLGATLACAVAAGPLVALAQSVTVIVDGQTMSFDQPPIVRAGRVFVPLRSVFERLGASVVYANGQINATGRGRTVSLTIGSVNATVDGQPVTIDVAPFIIGSRTLVPLRFIAQSLGATVDWNDSTSTVTIRSGGARPPVPPPGGGIAIVDQAPVGTIYNHRPQIRFQVNRPVRIGSFQVLLDGRDISAGLSFNGQYYVVPTPFSLPYGQHRVRVFGRTAAGVAFDQTWTFMQASY